MKDLRYPGFDYPADQIKRFAQSENLFTMLINDTIVHYESLLPHDFRDWLDFHQIPDAKTTIDSDKDLRKASI
ncbi:MAG: hypothetical protein QHC79_25565 [Pseudosphingobacterium sp.]|nr:hypothetical protein [Pseudosphingobacterium sp.]